MIIGARRAILIGAIAAVALTIIFLPVLFSSTASGLDRVVIELSEIRVGELKPEEQSFPITVIFLVTNPTDLALTTSKIDYELFADGISLVNHVLSYEDVPPPGRPPFFKDQPVELPSTVTIRNSDLDNDALFSRIAESSEAVQWSIKGTAEINSSLTLAQKDFSDEL